LFKNPIVHQLWTARQEAKKKSCENKKAKVLESKDNIISSSIFKPTGKPPSSARVEVAYPFQTDPMLWESYRNPWGQVRVGKLLEDLDALAGNIAFFHVDSDEVAPYQNFPVIVTASVDKISVRERPTSASNLLLSGQVAWTGRSSMEIRMKCIEEGATKEWLDAYVTYVALDSNTKKPIEVPPVLPATPEEVADFEGGEMRAAAKKRRRQQQKRAHSDSNEIEEMASNLLLDAGPLLNMPSLADPYSILLKNTRMQNASIAQPQTQNLHNRKYPFLKRTSLILQS
jgi:acyl-coenzyme A thioesterase 9